MDGTSSEHLYQVFQSSFNKIAGPSSSVVESPLASSLSPKLVSEYLNMEEFSTSNPEHWTSAQSSSSQHQQIMSYPPQSSDYFPGRNLSNSQIPSPGLSSGGTYYQDYYGNYDMGSTYSSNHHHYHWNPYGGANGSLGVIGSQNPNGSSNPPNQILPQPPSQPLSSSSSSPPNTSASIPLTETRNSIKCEGYEELLAYGSGLPLSIPPSQPPPPPHLPHPISHSHIGSSLSEDFTFLDSSSSSPGLPSSSSPGLDYINSGDGRRSRSSNCSKSSSTGGKGMSGRGKRKNSKDVLSEDLDPVIKAKRDKDRRFSNNTRERMRIRDINDALTELGRICMSLENKNKAEKPQTKLGVLNMAVEIITKLEQRVREKNLNPSVLCLNRSGGNGGSGGSSESNIGGTPSNLCR